MWYAIFFIQVICFFQSSRFSVSVQGIMGTNEGTINVVSESPPLKKRKTDENERKQSDIFFSREPDLKLTGKINVDHY